MAPGFTAEIARRATTLSATGVESDVAELARQCLLDFLGVTLAGSKEEAAAIVFDELAADAPDDGGATVVGRAIRLAPRDSALANGTASHALDYDDVNQSMFGHPTVPILPALLALAEVRGSSGSEVMTAFVAGYEAECAVGRALGGEHYQRGFHTTATAGTFGAAVACARLLDADAATAETALGIAATQAAGLKSMFGTMCKPLHAGLASAAGLLAARLAERGFSAAQGSIETVQGFGETHSASFDAERGLAEPPGGWFLRSHLFKYHAACYETHSAIEGLRHIRQEAHLAAHDVDSVTIHADDAQMRMCAIEEPSSGLETKFSLRHTAALVLAGLDTSAIATFDDTRARDPELLALRERVLVVADRTGGGPTPVEVRTRDGRVLMCAYDVAVPERDLSLQGKRLREKFESLAVPVVGQAGAGRIIELVGDLDTLDDVGALLAVAGG